MKNIIFLTIFFSISLLSDDSLKKVSLQFMWHDQFEFAGFYVAKEKGFFKDLGLEVEFKKFTVDTDITDKVMKQEAHFGMSSSSLLIDKSKGKDIVLLGSVFQSSPLALLTLKNSNIKTITDIKNKRIMLTFNQQYFASLQAMLASKNIGIKDIIPVKHSFDVKDLINKNTDLMLAYTTNEPYVLEEKGYEAKIFHPKDYGFDFYEELIFTSKEFALNNPETVKKFYEASKKGWEYAFNNITEVSKLIFEKYNPQKKTLASLIYEAVQMKKLSFTKEGTFGDITIEKLKLIENTYRVLGLLKNELNVEELIFFNKIQKKEKTLELSKKEKSYLNSISFIPMCVDPNWMPYEKLENGIHIGINADYYNLIEKSINKKIKVIETKSWSETLEFAKQGKCHIISLALETPLRKEYLNFSKTLLDATLVIATDLRTSFILSKNELANKKLGIIKDYAYTEILKEKYPNIEFVEFSDIKKGLGAVLSGKTFGYVDVLINVAHEIQKNFPSVLKISGEFDVKIDLKIASIKEQPLLNKILNKAIDTISEKQKQDILNKWISVKYEKGLDYKFFYKVLLVLIIISFSFIIIYRQMLLKKANKNLQEKVRSEIHKNNQKHKLITQQTKKVAMAEILENIAHQWRQPLSIISVAATGIKMKKEYGILEEKDLIIAIDSINTHTQLLSATIDDFSNFYKDEKIFKYFLIKDTIEKALDLFKIQFEQKNIIVKKNILNTKIYSQEKELIQILMNLFNNSKDALLNLDKEERFIFIKTYKKNKKLNIEIKDNGGGVDEKILEKIFEPYFTTKHKSQGTGIGLYTSEQIITSLKGVINVKNESFVYKDKKYTGAVFTIVLPLEV